MKNILKFLGLIAAILLASAFLAPLLYPLLPYKFERIFNRLVMIFSLTALVFFLKGRRFRLSDYGLDWRGRPAGKYLWAGFLTGLLILALFSFVKVAAAQAAWIIPQTGLIPWAARLAGALGAGFLIAVIEEFFFRGFIYRSLSDNGRRRIFLAYLGTSAFYALVHFVSFEKPFVDATPDTLDALRLAAAPFMSLLKFQQYWPEALGLLLFGLVLNHASVTAGSLYPAIGLHAGCVFYVKSDELFLSFLNTNRLVFASGKFYDGLLGWIFMLLMGLILTAAIRKIQAGKGRGSHG